MNGLDPRIARVEFWRRGPVGVSNVETVDRADLAIITVPLAGGVASGSHALCFELPSQRVDLNTTIAVLNRVFALGRRDVIRQVRDIFEEPRANG